VGAFVDGRVVEVATRTRTIPPALRRALHHRDRGCRFPGCGVRFGQGHHIRALWKCSAIPSRSSEPGTMRRGWSWPRGPRRRGGWGSAWTGAGRSTSCTRWHVV